MCWGWRLTSRWVLTALGRRQPGELACVQLVVSAHRAHPPWLKAVVWLAKLPFKIIIGLFDLFFTRTSSTATQPTVRPSGAAAVDDPAAAAAKKARDVKKAARPHLRTTVRVGSALRPTWTRPTPNVGTGCHGPRCEARQVKSLTDSRWWSLRRLCGTGVFGARDQGRRPYAWALVPRDADRTGCVVAHPGRADPLRHIRPASSQSPAWP